MQLHFEVSSVVPEGQLGGTVVEAAGTVVEVGAGTVVVGDGRPEVSVPLAEPPPPGLGAMFCSGAAGAGLADVAADREPWVTVAERATLSAMSATVRTS
jgi:hypothetical protein